MSTGGPQDAVWSAISELTPRQALWSTISGIRSAWRPTRRREHFVAILMGDVTLFADMLPKVLAGCLIGALVTMLLPREMVARWVGHESGFTGLLIAAFFGFLLPGGPITIYPVAGAFLVMGADAGAVVAFIVSWTLIGYTRALVWELPFFGSDFVIWRIIEALPLPIIAGLLARIAVRAGFQYREKTQ
jgi:uncharacterized membrane protein YraQ (UPF0718 family)